MHTCYAVEANTSHNDSLPSRCKDGPQNRALWIHATLSVSENQQGFPEKKRQNKYLSVLDSGLQIMSLALRD